MTKSTPFDALAITLVVQGWVKIGKLEMSPIWTKFICWSNVLHLNHWLSIKIKFDEHCPRLDQFWPNPEFDKSYVIWIIGYPWKSCLTNIVQGWTYFGKLKVSAILVKFRFWSHLRHFNQWPSINIKFGEHCPRKDQFWPNSYCGELYSIWIIGYPWKSSWRT